MAGPALVMGCGGEDTRNMSANQVAATLADVPIAPGAWEIASEVVHVAALNLPIEVRDRMIGGRPALRSCVTPEQAARPNARFLAAGDNDCTYADFTMRDGRMTGTMRCPDPNGGATVARMEGDYRREAYVLRMTIETPMPDGAVMRVQTRTMGRRIGACPAGTTP